MFHVSLLRPYRRKGGQPPPALLPDGQVEYEVEAILDHNDDVDNERFYHIKWVGYDVPSWETEAFVQKNCKDMIAEYFRKSARPTTGHCAGASEARKLLSLPEKQKLSTKNLRTAIGMPRLEIQNQIRTQVNIPRQKLKT